MVTTPIWPVQGDTQSLILKFQHQFFSICLLVIQTNLRGKELHHALGAHCMRRQIKMKLAVELSKFTDNNRVFDLCYGHTKYKTCLSMFVTGLEDFLATKRSCTG